MNLRVYVEGGGDRGELKARCRQGFTAFFQKAGFKDRMPRIIACGSRAKALDKFSSAFGKAMDDDFIVLLVDSEGPVAASSGSLFHLEKGGGWNKPAGATDDNAHLMVQCMEAWFLADKEALAGYFGDDFSINSLPRRLEVEAISTSDIEAGLKTATRRCKKGQYDKGNHSFQILAGLSPRKVTEASPHARRFIGILMSKTS